MQSGRIADFFLRILVIKYRIRMRQHHNALPDFILTIIEHQLVDDALVPDYLLDDAYMPLVLRDWRVYSIFLVILAKTYSAAEVPL